MSTERKSFDVTTSKDKSRQVFLLDPETASFSYVQELVKNKIRSTEETTFYMEFDDAYVYIDSVSLHEINRLPQQKKVKAIRQTAANIARSSRVLIYSIFS